MTWQPGVSGNPSGLTVRQQRTISIIQGLGPTSAIRLGKLVESDNEQVALGAIKEVLSRIAPIPKAPINVSVEHGPSAHLAALLATAAATRDRLSAPTIDSQAVEIIDVPTNVLHSRGDE